MTLPRLPVAPRATSRPLRTALLIATMTTALAAPIVRAASPAATPDTSSWVPTKTQAHEARGAAHVAALRAGVPVRVSVTLKLRDRAGLDALTADLMAGRTNRHLTSEEFLAKHAPTEAQVSAVVAHLAQQGFTDIQVADNRLVVTATGNAASVQRAFRAEMHEYEIDGRRAYANATPALVPKHLADTVLAVTGLQNVHTAHVSMKRPTAATEGMTPQGVGSVSTPSLAQIYGANTLPSASNATIGVVTAGNMAQVVTDLKAFASSAGYPVPAVSVITVGIAGTDTSAQSEWDMDTQASLAVAGGTIRSMLLYTAQTLEDGDLTATFNRIVSDNKAKAINVSLGECEKDSHDTGVMASDDQVFQVAMAQGQTFSVSSGDSGAFECGSTVSASYPASSPYVMAIGGTTLSHVGSTYSSETAWSCTNSTDCQQSASGGTGGGSSAYEAAPSWQTSAGVLGSATTRGVPDIAFDANPASGALILVSGSYQIIGGTSLAAPIFAGFWARIQSAHGNTLGFPASTLYAGAATHATWFHDVTSGNNGHFAAATGWDYTTGYGSLQVKNFASAFGTAPVANFSVARTLLKALFTDQSGVTSGTITARDWNFGDGSGHSSSTNPSHTYAAAGTYTVTLKITDSLGHTASKVVPVTVSATVAPRELMINGNFEAGGGMPWSISTGVLCTTAACSPEPAHGGSGFLWFGGLGTAHTDYASQTIQIPGGATTATLTYWLKIESSDTGSVAHDVFKTQILNTAGTVLTTFYTYSNLNRGSSYTLKTFDVTPYIGQTVTVRFTGVEDGSITTSFLLDDVSVRVK